MRIRQRRVGTQAPVMRRPAPLSGSDIAKSRASLDRNPPGWWRVDWFAQRALIGPHRASTAFASRVYRSRIARRPDLRSAILLTRCAVLLRRFAKPQPSSQRSGRLARDLHRRALPRPREVAAAGQRLQPRHCVQIEQRPAVCAFEPVLRQQRVQRLQWDIGEVTSLVGVDSDELTFEHRVGDRQRINQRDAVPAGDRDSLIRRGGFRLPLPSAVQCPSQPQRLNGLEQVVHRAVFERGDRMLCVRGAAAGWRPRR